MSADLPDILTVDELAKALRIGRNAAYELVRKDGPIRAVKIGRSIRIPRSAVEAFLDSSLPRLGTGSRDD